MADVQDHPQDELLWDQRALSAAQDLTDERTAAAGMGGGVAALLPSLHLNLALCHEKLQHVTQSRQHVLCCRQSLARLPNDDYGAFIRASLTELEQRLPGTV